MSEFRGAEIPTFGLSFAKMGSEATRHLCEQGQMFAKAVGEWNTAVGHFLSHRVARNREAMARMAKCGNFQDAFSVQTEWFQNTTDDYLKEFGKLMEVNGRLVGDALRPVQEAAVSLSEPARSSAAKVPMKASSGD